MKDHAPRVATWLADRFLTNRTRESLIGDLMEQYREGRSAAWYWGSDGIITANPPPPGVPQTTVILVSFVSVLLRPAAVLVGGVWGTRNRHEAPAGALD